MLTEEQEEKTLRFRCPPELRDVLPPPVPAGLGMPEWLKAMPQRTPSVLNFHEDDTVKRCPPFVDAMTKGFLLPLMCDVRVENGEFSWANDFPAGGEIGFVRSPIGFHEESQVVGTPLFEADHFLVKFHNLWTIEAPEGYALLFTHPFNRHDLPFTTLTGMVDSDRYTENWIHFPAHWHDMSFNGVLPKGTPVAQCIPVRRDNWTADIASLTSGEMQRVHDLAFRMNSESGVYRRQFRA